MGSEHGPRSPTRKRVSPGLRAFVTATRFALTPSRPPVRVFYPAAGAAATVLTLGRYFPPSLVVVYFVILTYLLILHLLRPRCVSTRQRQPRRLIDRAPPVFECRTCVCVCDLCHSRVCACACVAFAISSERRSVCVALVAVVGRRYTYTVYLLTIYSLTD